MPASSQQHTQQGACMHVTCRLRCATVAGAPAGSQDTHPVLTGTSEHPLASNSTATASMYCSAPANVVSRSRASTEHDSLLAVPGDWWPAGGVEGWSLSGQGSTEGCPVAAADQLGFTIADLEELELQGRHLTPRADRSSRGSYFSLPDLSLNLSHDSDSQCSEGGASSGGAAVSSGDPRLRRVNTGGSGRLNSSSGLLRQSLTRAAAEQASLHRRTASSGGGGGVPQAAPRPPLPAPSHLKTAASKTYMGAAATAARSSPAPSLCHLVPPPPSLPGLKICPPGDEACSSPQSLTLLSSPPGCSIRSALTEHMSGSSRPASPLCNSPLWQPPDVPSYEAPPLTGASQAACPVFPAVLSRHASKEQACVATTALSHAAAVQAGGASSHTPGPRAAATALALQLEGLKLNNPADVLDVADTPLLNQTSITKPVDISGLPTSPIIAHTPPVTVATAAVVTAPCETLQQEGPHVTGRLDSRDVPRYQEVAPPPPTPVKVCTNTPLPTTIPAIPVPPTDALDDHLAGLTTITTTISRPASTPDLQHHAPPSVMQRRQQQLNVSVLFGSSHAQPPLLMTTPRPGLAPYHHHHHQHCGTCHLMTSPRSSAHQPSPGGGLAALGRSSSPCLASVPEADKLSGACCCCGWSGGKVPREGSSSDTSTRWGLLQVGPCCSSPDGSLAESTLPGGKPGSSFSTPLWRHPMGWGGDLAPTPTAPCRHSLPAYDDSIPALPLGSLPRTSHPSCKDASRHPCSSSSSVSSTTSGWHQPCSHHQLFGAGGSTGQPGSGPGSGSGQMLFRPCCGCSVNGAQGCGSLSSWGSAMSVASLAAFLTSQRSTTSQVPPAAGTPVKP
jgi:hypothetical protein